LSAALASYGSLAFFGIESVTPEATTLHKALDSVPIARRIDIGQADLDTIYRRWSADSEDADLVVFSGPQLSLLEFQMLAEMLDGQRVHDKTTLIVTSNHGVASVAEKLGYVEIIRRAGGVFLEGVCFYLLELDRLQRLHGWKTVVTNSAKLCNIIGSFDYQPVLHRTSDCVRSAIAGKVVHHSV